MEDKRDKKIAKQQAVIITLCTVIIGLGSYIFYISNTLCPQKGQRCEYNGWAYADGESFKSIDGCNNCSCNNGNVSCTEMACEKTSGTCNSEGNCTN